MKKLITASIILLLTAAWGIARAQQTPTEYLGLPGDNLNLYAVMTLFQESETLEGFEQKLNDKNTMVNNLDLNGDRYVDYIMVHDYADGDVHTIVLRTAMSKNDYQDVAVFTVERFRDGSVYIQLIGDEALYGPNYIVEPIYADAAYTPNPGYTGNNGNAQVVRTTTYQVAAWPVVRYIYQPTYVIYRSPWIWGRRYAYWNPWRPVYYHHYYGYHYNYHPHYYANYHINNHYRYSGYNEVYYSKVRVYSPRVSVKIKEGRYNNTYSRPETRKNGEEQYVRVNARQVERSGGNTPSRENPAVTRPRNSTGGQAVESTRRTAGTNGNQPAKSTNVEAPRRAAGTNANQPAARSTNVEAPRRTEGSNANQPAKSTNVEAPRRTSATEANQPAARSTNVEAPRRTSATEAKQPARSTSQDKKVEAPRRNTPSAASQPAKSASVERKAETPSRPAARVTEQAAPRKQSTPRESARQAPASQPKAAVSKERPATRERATEKKASDNKSSSSSSPRRR